MGIEVRTALNTLRDFMFEKVYIPEDLGAEGRAAREIVRLLYDHLSEHSSLVPPEYATISGSDALAVADYLAGMTDRFALRMAEQIRPGIAAVFANRLL